MERSVANDVSHFRTLMSEATQKLASLCSIWDHKLNEDIPEKTKEEVFGRIRSASGKARILTSAKGRLHQFERLVDNCELNLGEKKTTCTDLQGFWEMIKIQLEDVSRSFEDLQALEKNQWQVPEPACVAPPPPPKSKKKISSRAGVEKPVTANKPSSGLRALMAAKRKEIRNPTTSVDAVAPSSSAFPSTEVEKVFEGGFFRVTSPTKFNKSNSEASATQRNAAGFESIQLTPYKSASESRRDSVFSTPNTSDREPCRADRSILGSAARRLQTTRAPTASDNTPFAIMRVSSAVRRSISMESTPSGERPLEPFFTRTTSDHGSSENASVTPAFNAGNANKALHDEFKAMQTSKAVIRLETHC